MCLKPESSRRYHLEAKPGGGYTRITGAFSNLAVVIKDGKKVNLDAQASEEVPLIFQEAVAWVNLPLTLSPLRERVTGFAKVPFDRLSVKTDDCSHLKKETQRWKQQRTLLPQVKPLPQHKTAIQRYESCVSPAATSGGPKASMQTSWAGSWSTISRVLLRSG